MRTVTGVGLVLAGAAFVVTTGVSWPIQASQRNTSPPPAVNGQEITLPRVSGSVRFAVIGDTGSGGSAQARIATALDRARTTFPFDIVLMLGDNVHGNRPLDYSNKFETPFEPLLGAGVSFYAALGHQDDPEQRFYTLFNMNGHRYYTFTPTSTNVRFVSLDSSRLDPVQVTWLEKELGSSQSEWKIVFLHHPLYSSGTAQESNIRLRQQLEPIFVKHRVDVVFSAHDNFYERIKPQNGIHYFVSGAAAKLRKGNFRTSGLTEKGFDAGYHYMLVEIAGDTMHFQAISDEGKTVDAGRVVRSRT